MRFTCAATVLEDGRHPRPCKKLARAGKWTCKHHNAAEKMIARKMERQR